MNDRADVAVLGAGIVGVSAALHLQSRGRDVVLVDRHGSAGRETSYGNAGLIERSSFLPHSFPRDLGALLTYARGASPAHYHRSALLRIAGFLARYWRASSPTGVRRTALALRPLVLACLAEHESLIEAAGAERLVRHEGWIKVFRTAKGEDEAGAEAEALAAFGATLERLDPGRLAALEPHLEPGLRGGVHFRDPASVSDPGALVEAYARLFVARGGRFVAGDARTLTQAGDGWTLRTDAGDLATRDVVIALGPWADEILRPLGYRIPFAVKRGYHRHYRPQGNAVLNRPVLDAENGYVLAPMAAGIRLTTGAEFALRDAPPTPVQLAALEPVARRFFPIGEAVEPAPWLGARPCLPDMVPIIGPAPRHRGLWFDFGHQHLGLTLGPVSGRLIAEMICGEPTFADPTPYAIERFG